MKSIETSGKTVEDAIKAGLRELNCDFADVTIDVKDAGSPGLFGMFGRLAKVRLTVKEDEKLDLQMPVFSLNVQEEKKVKQPKPLKAEPPKPEKAEKVEKIEKAEKADKPEKTEKPEKIEKLEKAEAAKPKTEPRPIEQREPKAPAEQQPKPRQESADRPPRPQQRPVGEKPQEGAKPHQDRPPRQDRQEPDRPLRPEQRPPRPEQRQPRPEQQSADGAKAAVKPQKPRPQKPYDPTPIQVEIKDLPKTDPATLGEVGKVAYEFLSEVTRLMGVSVEIRVQETEDHLDVQMIGDSLGVLIGRRGDTLDALQYLTSLQVNKHRDQYVRVSLDTEHYRAKRVEALTKLASRMAARVHKTGHRVALEPMNPYERRILHSALQNHPHVTTHSEGEEPYRRVIITHK